MPNIMNALQPLQNRVAAQDHTFFSKDWIIMNPEKVRNT